MPQNLIESIQVRLSSVHEAISIYDDMRPLNAAAREYQGLPGAWSIAAGEAIELSDIRLEVDSIPPERLNGQRLMVQQELGDLVFGVAEVLRYLPVEAMNSDQLATVLEWGRMVRETEVRYGLDAVKAGVDVNLGKNQVNNPAWAFQSHHPLDNPAETRDKNDIVRRGLRAIRDKDLGGKMDPANLEAAIIHFGYTEAVLRDSPALATHFLRQVAIHGFRL